MKNSYTTEGTETSPESEAEDRETKQITLIFQTLTNLPCKKENPIISNAWSTKSRRREREILIDRRLKKLSKGRNGCNSV